MRGAPLPLLHALPGGTMHWRTGKSWGYWPKTRNKYYYKLNHAGGEDKNLFPGFFFREESVIFACKKTNKV